MPYRKNKIERILKAQKGKVVPVSQETFYELTQPSVKKADGNNHEHTDDAGSMDLYYEFDGGSGIPTSVLMLIGKLKI